MEYITTKEASAKWGISTIRITILANEGRIPGAHRLGKSWLIPASATKPVEFKPNQARLARKKIDNFSFPLYHFRPDWNQINESELSEQQRSLLRAESAVLECRFTDACSILESILRAPDDNYIEIAGLGYAGMCSIALNRPDDFSEIYLKLKLKLSKNFPHRDDMIVVLDFLKTYIETSAYIANNADYNIDIHEQCLPMICILNGYANLSREVAHHGTADTKSMELNLRLLRNTSSVISIEAMHLYLLGIYYLRQDIAAAEKHAKIAVQIAYENKIYLPLATYMRYFEPILSPFIASLPEDFQNQCTELFTQFNHNFAAFTASINEYTHVSELADDDFPYIYAVATDASNAFIADELGVSIYIVQRRIAKICKVLGVKNKAALKEYIHKYW